ncbi:MAG: VCBS repeat-containing protein [Planctomycetes bacterium]|nr:VCBS repeat-containing protein [Planctomycetota bacterium]
MRWLAPVTLFAVPAAAQQFVRDQSSSPANAGNYTEDVDFADVDNDGDWDAAFANGGDNGQLQNTLWINQGFAQGGTLGAFLDATAARCPAVLDQSREIEFADIDGDGDVDAHVSNHAQFVNQGNRWWANQGGSQGGAIGFFADETAARWVGLGGPGSSIAPSQLLVGTFLDFCFDSEFADWDADGDLDLVHSSCGSSVVGNIPTRLFLNDGAGHFSEFNPSGVQLGGQAIPNGVAGLWCAGVQTANTLDATGSACDIAASTIDVDVADVDGDLDLDLLLGSRSELPRLFRNRSNETGGTLAWRDVTGATFTTGYATGQGHYAQEFGDLDGDADLDLYGLNWLVTSSQFADGTYANDGAGHFGAPATIALSLQDENEVDVIDYDGDGDLDMILANYAGQEALCRNDGVFPLVRITSPLPADNTNSLDVDVADVDGDGDYDAFVSNNNIGPSSDEWYLRNTTLVNDITPPTLSRLEQAPNRSVSPVPTIVRVHVTDNAPAYVTARANAWLELRVNGGPAFPVALRWSGAQVFRAAIPGSFAGVVSYRAIVIDEHGNTATSVEKSFTATDSTAGLAFCLGDGTQTPCPCGNVGSAGNGCANSSNPSGALLVATGATANDSIVLGATAMPSTVSAIYLKGDQGLATGVVFGDGIRCVDGALIRLRTKQNVAGASQFPDSTDTLTVGVRGGTPPGSGLVGYYQTYYRNAAAAFCPPATFNVTNGVVLAW